MMFSVTSQSVKREEPQVIIYLGASVLQKYPSWSLPLLITWFCSTKLPVLCTQKLAVAVCPVSLTSWVAASAVAISGML